MDLKKDNVSETNEDILFESSEYNESCENLFGGY